MKWLTGKAPTPNWSYEQLRLWPIEEELSGLGTRGMVERMLSESTSAETTSQSMSDLVKILTAIWLVWQMMSRIAEIVCRLRAKKAPKNGENGC